jgi:ABC-type multidrug transport system fused ATPase/permease subunit
MLGCAMLITVTLLLLSLYISMSRCADVSTRRDLSLNAVQEEIDETLRNLPAVYASMQKEQQMQRIDVHEDAFGNLYYDTTRCAMSIKACMVPTTITLVGFTLWRCRNLTRASKMSAGTFVSVFLVIIYLMSSMMRTAAYGKAMVYHWGIVNASSSMFDHCNKTKNNSKNNNNNNNNIPLSGFGMVDVSYAPSGSTKETLHGATLHVEPGERVAIVGPVGSGKTTLIRLLMRLVEPSSGTVYKHGSTYKDLSVQEVRRDFGYVPQSPILFDRTVIENLRFGNDGVTEADVWDAAERIGAVEALRAIGLDTPVGKGGTRLSGGQRQMVWMLRVLLVNPAVIIMDEPTSALDDESKALVLAVIDAVGTAVVVTHDTAFVKAFATRTIEVHDGTPGA